MPLLYRSMKEENGKPKIERSASGLGVRVEGRHSDIDLETDGTVKMNYKGMSVVPSPEYLPAWRVYEGLAHIVEGASSTDESLRIWRMGEGTFVADNITPELVLIPDAPRTEGITHGVVAPVNVMPLTEYEVALASTQDQWVIDETGA